MKRKNRMLNLILSRIRVAICPRSTICSYCRSAARFTFCMKAHSDSRVHRKINCIVVVEEEEEKGSKWAIVTLTSPLSL
jgi:hypothetical protein